MTVRLLFPKKFVIAIIERTRQPSRRIRDRRDGSFELELLAAPNIELVRWILSWTPDVRVLAPRSLRVRANSHVNASATRSGAEIVSKR